MLEIRQTDDGSQSLYARNFDALYHSKFGALEESIHVYISGGLEHVLTRSEKEVHIFEMGFGTGLNALLSLIIAEERKVKVSYTGIECFPVEADIVHKLDYCSLLQREKLNPSFVKLHEVIWDHTYHISPNFTFKKIKGDFSTYVPNSLYDVVYYDAFSPGIQDHLWDKDHMSKCFNMIKPGGVLVTYCAKGIFKRTLRSAGFEVEALPGPSGKREMTRAYKKPVT